MAKASVIRAESAEDDLHWCGLDFDECGNERERRYFRTRSEARAWVKHMKRREHGDLREMAG